MVDIAHSPRSRLGGHARFISIVGVVTAACGNGSSDPSSGAGAQSGALGAGPGGTNGASGVTAQSAASSGTGVTMSSSLYGDPHAGAYNLGPVDFAETQFHNSCAPYPAAIQTVTGDYLAGVGLDFNGGGELCDACILVTTGTGKTVVARVVTTGSTNGPNDIDLSKAAYDLINTGEYPRNMTWQLAKCGDTGSLAYQFQTGANVYWTSLWVRNERVPISKVEVQSTNHPSFIELVRGGDGTLTDASGFGDGAFTFRITTVDGQVIDDPFPSFQPGQLVMSAQQFK